MILVGAGAKSDPAWSQWVQDDRVAFHAMPDQVEFLRHTLSLGIHIPELGLSIGVPLPGR